MRPALFGYMKGYDAGPGTFRTVGTPGCAVTSVELCQDLTGDGTNDASVGP
jgi:hypothetical protein